MTEPAEKSRAPYKPVRIRQVRKRDGSVVAFDRAKVAVAIFKAAQAVGGSDRFMSEELADVVAFFLEKHFEGDVPGIEDIQDMVEKVLIETGHARTAKAYILYRQKRAEVRQRLQVRISRHENDLKVAEGRGIGRWERDRIVKALEVEAGLPGNVAREIAGAVEKRIFHSGLARISTALIRALVDNELFERGYDSSLRKQATVGVPKYDLEQLLLRPGGTGAVNRAIAEDTWRRYALQEVYSRDIAEAHLEGMIHIHHIGRPLAAFARLAGAPAGPGLGGLFGAVFPILPETAEAAGVPEEVLRAVGIGGAGTERDLEGFAQALRGLHERPGEVVLEGDLSSRDGAVAEALLAVVRSGRVAPFSVAIRSGASTLTRSGMRDLLSEAVTCAPEGGFSAILDEGECLVPACRSGDGAVVCLAGVSVNLPMVVFKNHRGGPEAVREDVKQTIRSALDVHRQKTEFLVNAGVRMTGRLVVDLFGAAAAARLAPAGMFRGAGDVLALAERFIAEEAGRQGISAAAIRLGRGDAWRRLAGINRETGMEPDPNGEDAGMPRRQTLEYDGTRPAAAGGIAEVMAVPGRILRFSKQNG
ncbi:MAG: ATP cone domain-containing protein [Planctomycetota bacterium]